MKNTDAKIDVNVNKGKYDFLIPWYFVMFFLVVFAVDGTIIYLASTSHRGVVDKNSYVKGLNFNDRINEYNEQKKLGWSSDIKLENGNTLTVSLNDKNAEFISGAKLSAVIFRPVQDGSDFEVSFKENAGVYSTEIDFPFNGLWQVKMLAVKDKNSYRDSKRIVVE